MVTKIDKKIVGSEVFTTPQPTGQPAPSGVVVQMHEAVERPDTLAGNTIKLKNPLMEAAIYLTVNHVVLNPGTPHETVRPFEVFINSKDTNSQQWIQAITLLMSAVFRKGGDFTFMINELKAVHDPKGGFFLPGGVAVPSVIAHIGIALEQHLYTIGAMKKIELSEEVRALVDQKREEAQSRGALEHASECPKCHTRSLVIMDGCQTCLDCGQSKCG